MVNGDSSGVIYRIKCTDCNYSYFWETCDLKRRIYQHSYSKRTWDLNNAIVKHMWEKDHRMDIDNANIIIREQDKNKRKLIESIIINNTNNINIDKCNHNLNKFSERIAISNNKRLKNLKRDKHLLN